MGIPDILGIRKRQVRKVQALIDAHNDRVDRAAGGRIGDWQMTEEEAQDFRDTYYLDDIVEEEPEGPPAQPKW